VKRTEIRNVAIIAHVDHGKTTLLDGLLRQSGAFRTNQVVATRVMDSEDLERERGITIHAKTTSVEYEDVRIHLVDTPGHADFGGEVERVLGLVDSALLLVDAAEGVMPQTRFVLRKALSAGLRPILVVNKIDRSDQRAAEIATEVFDLLVELGANDEQLDFPVVYAVGRDGLAKLDLAEEARDLRPLFETILKHAPAPDVDVEAPLQFQAVTLDHDSYLGRLVIGRVVRGTLRRGDMVSRVAADGSLESFRITKLFGARGLKRVELESAGAGELATIAGVDSIDIGDTLCPLGKPDPLPRIPIDPPTVRVVFSVNNSPFAGQEGRYVTSRQVGERLRREALSNVSIDVNDADTAESFEVAGRGELQIAILIETLRREGYEFSVSRPEIIPRQIDGQRCEPVEDVSIEVPDSCTGRVLEAMAARKARMIHMDPRGGRTLLQFVAPSRGLFGYRTQFLSETRGEGVMYRTVTGYEPHAGAMAGRPVGALIATEPGKTTPYALFQIQDRMTLFVEAGVPVYEGQIIGENNRVQDMNVNVCRAKKLTNIRAAGKDDNVMLSPPRQVTIEGALEWIESDELLEVTPQSLRLRKRLLAGALRKRPTRATE
jgi:GTP-binding protein